MSVPYCQLTLQRCLVGSIVTNADVSFLVNNLCKHAHKWRDIGLALNFQPGELENISHPNPGATAQRLLTELLSQWSQWPTADHSDAPTMERLRDVLRSGLVGLGQWPMTSTNSEPSYRPSKSDHIISVVYRICSIPHFYQQWLAMVTNYILMISIGIGLGFGGRECVGVIRKGGCGFESIEFEMT